jgi:phosphoserine phosphatase
MTAPFTQSAITKMVYSHTDNTELAFKQIENALKGATQDDLNTLVNEIKELYQKALAIQELYNEFNSGFYDIN